MLLPIADSSRSRAAWPQLYTQDEAAQKWIHTQPRSHRLPAQMIQLRVVQPHAHMPVSFSRVSHLLQKMRLNLRRNTRFRGLRGRAPNKRHLCYQMPCLRGQCRPALSIPTVSVPTFHGSGA